jgi:hypothetical protein
MWCLPAGCDTQSANDTSICRFTVFSLNLQDMGYLSRMFWIVQQELRDYIVTLQYVLPYVTATLTSVIYVEKSHEARKNVHYPICMKC